MAGSTPLVFKVRRCEPELVSPAKPTPRVLKELSDIDDQDGLRFQIPVIQFYRYHPSMQGRDPVKVIRQALAHALVYHYPFAGRLREIDGGTRKLAVDCTGEGVVFIEADADVGLKDFGEALHPPFPCLEELLFDVPGSGEVLHSPLLLLQVTRLSCGGIVLAMRLNHTMCDAAGLVQLMTAMAEIARGAASPSLLPVWQRHLLNSRNPPSITFTHREYDQVLDTKATFIPHHNMLHRSFFFGPTEISALLRTVPPHQRRTSTTFELVTACLWRCRTIALQLEPEEEVRIICIVNACSKINPPLPVGYYGNTFAFPVAVSTAGKLMKNPFGYGLELVKKAKAEVTEEYLRSVADLMVMRGRPHFAVAGSYLVSDLTYAGFGEVDFGWGKAAYGGVGPIPGLASFYVPLVNNRGEKGIVVPICLPAAAMDRFVKELDSLIVPLASKTCITSAL